jgi:hypothetical protein
MLKAINLIHIMRDTDNAPDLGVVEEVFKLRFDPLP